MKQFLGKYRGKVENNTDPSGRGRLQISVPLVLGKGKNSWAMPCVPYAGLDVGWFVMPPKGANIWVEFEGGDPDYPIWTGCFWGEDELPKEASGPKVKILKTKAITLQMIDDDSDGGLLLKVDKPVVDKPLTIKLDKKGISLINQTAKVILDQNGIRLINNEQTIKLSQQNILFNQGALEIS